MKPILLSFLIYVCYTACAMTIHAGVPETRRFPEHFQAGSTEITESHSDNSANLDSLSSFPNSVKSVPSVNDRGETNYITPLQRRYYLKSNAVGWAMLVSNIAFEFDVAERLSVEIPIYFSAMNYFSSKVKFRTAMIQPELRYWFNASTPSGIRDGTPECISESDISTTRLVAATAIKTTAVTTRQPEAVCRPDGEQTSMLRGAGKWNCRPVSASMPQNTTNSKTASTANMSNAAYPARFSASTVSPCHLYILSENSNLL